MKITDIHCYLTYDTGPAVFVEIETDEGVTGYGDASNHFIPQATAGMVNDLAPFLIDQDPRDIERLWQTCFRSRFMRGGPATGSAIAGIDMALWDLKGKLLGVPVYQLLGGKARDTVRLYGHIGGTSPDQIAGQAKERVSRGVTALRFRAFHTYDREGLHDHRLAVEQQVEYVKAVRDAIGYQADIIVECHGRYDPQWAVELAERIAQYRPFFFEDPIRHENPQVMVELRRQVQIPLATGERGHSRWDLKDLLISNAINYVRPDICHCGGITEIRRIAALAETYYIDLVPHNNAGPLGTAASVHACISMPNVAMLEGPWINAVTHERAVVWPYPEIVNGYAIPSEEPGLGVSFDKGKAESIPFRPAEVPVLKGFDGSIRDW